MSSPIASKILGESLEAAKPLKVIEASRPVTYMVCPHCQAEIHEKHIGMNESGQDFHRDCGGLIELPEADISTVAPWLRASVEKVRADRKAGLNPFAP